MGVSDNVFQLRNCSTMITCSYSKTPVCACVCVCVCGVVCGRWSYGIVLWEILTYGDLPYGKTPMASSIETLASFLKSGHRLVQPASCTSPT